MYKFLIKIVKLIELVFRIFQVLGLVYLFMYIIYWFMQMGQAEIVYKYDGWYSYFTPLTNMLFDAVPELQSEEFAIFHLDTIISILIYVGILLLYNFVFVFLGGIEDRLVLRGYRVGELQDSDLPYNKV